MLSNKVIIRLSIFFGIFSWIFLAGTDLLILFARINEIDSGIASFVPRLLLMVLVLSLFTLFKYHLRESESINILDLLWRVFVTGLIATIISLIIWFFFTMLGESRLTENPLVLSMAYHVNLGLILVFLLSTFLVWKKLILYQKTKKLLLAWKIFEYSFLGSLLLFLFKTELPQGFFIGLLLVLVIMGIYLSVNLKWVAYLNFRQKWKSILLILLIGLYLWYFIYYGFNFASNHTGILIINLLNHESLLALFSFIFIYAIFSLLVILFNLPTSSVFEQKLEEVVNFQRLSQSRYSGQNEDQIYEILLESSVSAVMANAGWLETLLKDGSKKSLHWKINQEKIEEVKTHINTTKIKSILSTDYVRNIKPNRFTASLDDPDFKSILVFPLYIQNKQAGTLFLLKDVYDSFNKDVIEIIKTFVNQASISIENFRLLEEAIENERYKEELKIAKRVQKSLLPDSLYQNELFQISAFSKAADEVGGDYYDTYQIDPQRFALIIGDVSGKGTSAAFNMSQMKGVFHSLVDLHLPPAEFLTHANNALSRCLEKTSFITATFLILDTTKNEIEIARAGHCPALFYSAAQNKVTYIQSRGLGLGILRNKQFSKYIETKKIVFAPGDLLVLFTDGLIEAHDGNHEQFGYQRLQEFIMNNFEDPPETLQQKLLKRIYEYGENEAPEDDFTTLIIRFTGSGNIKPE